MGDLHRNHALQVIECGERATGVFGLPVELFVGQGFLRCGNIGPRFEHLGAFHSSGSQRAEQQRA